MKQETLNILFLILKNKQKLLKNGETPVILRVTIEGRGSDEARIQRSIDPKLWDQAKGRSKGKDWASLELGIFSYFVRKRRKIFISIMDLMNAPMMHPVCNINRKMDLKQQYETPH